MTDPTDPTGKQMDDPLTPAELAALEQWAEDRAATIAASVNAAVENAIAPLREQLSSLTEQVATMEEALAVLDSAALKIGGKLALRIASGKLLCVRDGGPDQDGDPVHFEARSSIGHWETFLTERGV